MARVTPIRPDIIIPDPEAPPTPFKHDLPKDLRGTSGWRTLSRDMTPGERQFFRKVVILREDRDSVCRALQITKATFYGKCQRLGIRYGEMKLMAVSTYMDSWIRSTVEVTIESDGKLTIRNAREGIAEVEQTTTLRVTKETVVSSRQIMSQHTLRMIYDMHKRDISPAIICLMLDVHKTEYKALLDQAMTRFSPLLK